MNSSCHVYSVFILLNFYYITFIAFNKHNCEKTAARKHGREKQYYGICETMDTDYC